MKYWIIAGFLIWIGLAGCKTVVKTYQKPTMNTDSLFRKNEMTVNRDTGNMGRMPWKKLFAAPKLQVLIDSAIANNLDLKAAYSKINQQEAYLEQSKLAYYPDLNATASYDLAKTMNSSGSSRSDVHLAQLGVTSSWQADIWGKLKSSQDANLANLLAAQEYQKSVQTRLVSAVASDYYQLMAYDAQLEVMYQTIASWKETVHVMTVLKEGNVVTEAAVVQSQANLNAAQAAVPDLMRNIRVMENAICNLLGEPSRAIARDSLGIDPISSQVIAGVPLEMVNQRPDILMAEAQFRNAFQLTNVARTSFYPDLTLTANGGLANGNFKNLFSINSLIGGVLAGLTQPIFNKGINKANLKIATENQHQALYNYQKVILNAGQEVSNALYDYQTSQSKIAPRKEQLVNLEKSVDYTQKLVKNGFANYSEVLIAIQSLLSARLNQINDFLQRDQAVISLYQSLGGGVY